MKTQLSSLEAHYLVKELKFLIGGRVDKIFQVDKKEFYLLLHVPSIGKKILRITDKLMYLTSNKPSTETPPGFCMYLRKQLGNGKLKEISQKESERIIEFVFEVKEGLRKLVVELFGGGNLLILDENNVILSATHYEKYKDRDVLAKNDYNYPKMKYNLFELKILNLRELMLKSNKDNIVKCLAVDLGLGGIYSEEICLLAKVDKNQRPGNLKNSEVDEIYSTINKITNKKINSQIIYKDKEAIDAAPFKLEFYKDNEAKEFETFNSALEHYFINELKLVKKKESPYESKINELKRIVSEQEDTIKKFNDKVAENTKKGELIYSNYSLIKEIIEEINKAKEKHSWKDIKKKLKGHKVIKDVDIKDKRIVIEVG